MNVLSLFDGISCGQIALQRAGIPVTNYYASEIDKHAISVAKNNFPNTIHIGSCLHTNVPKNFVVDLLIGGSPCQGFSFNGKGLNFEDERSKLFFEYVRVLRQIRRYSPEVRFLLENVNMQQMHQDVISEYMGCKPVKINSIHFSAQSRVRLYWTNIPIASLPTCGLAFNDIVADDVTANHFLRNCYTDTLKLDPNRNRLEVLVDNIRGNSPSLKVPVLYTEIINDTPSKISRQSDRVYCSMSKSPCLTARGACNIKFNMNSDNPDDWRKITVTEAERLQTLPDGYTKGVPVSSRFNALGNGWTVDVISHIFKGLLTTSPIKQP